MEQQRSRIWRTPQTLVAVVVAVAIGGLGGAAVYAATDGSPRTMAGGWHAPGGPVQGAPPPGSGGPPADQTGARGVLHSEYVVPDGRGGFTTKMTQTGTVDEVTLSSIVVRSDDGFTQIYVFPSAAVMPNRSVVAKDTVTVEATRTGPTVTLNRIGEGPPHRN